MINVSCLLVNAAKAASLLAILGSDVFEAPIERGVLLVFVDEGDCYCQPVFEDPVVTLPGCFTLTMSANEPVMSQGWCSGPQADCMLGPIKPRPCGQTSADYVVTHGGSGCCNNVAGRAFGQTAPLLAVIHVGVPEVLSVAFPSVACSGGSSVTIDVRCGQGTGGALESSWDVKYRCDPCTL